MHKYDYIIVGSGLAGLYAAWKASSHGSVAVITKALVRDSNSFNAQGGIAAVTSDDDAPEIHKDDTLIAGRGLCEDRSVDILVNEGPERIEEIIAEGMKFDSKNGILALGLEGGHHKRRILHAGGDSTGKWITEFTISKVLQQDNIRIFENTLLLDLLIKNDECYGVRCWSNDSSLSDSTEGQEVLLYADHVFLTTGGTSAIYARTTNPETTVGDGVAIAYKAGCRIIDMEFIQFHPSGLYLKDSPQAFLISEAVRGEKAHLLNKAGKRFMVPIHELAELAPRDIVARSIFKQMKADGMPYVTLSLRHLDKEIPVAPAAHYSVGGILTNNNGMTDIKRLYACGEVSATGIMGANRLASNSLIECLVFANRAVEDSVKAGGVDTFPAFEKEYSIIPANKGTYAEVRRQIAEILNSHAGIIRTGEGLQEGLQMIGALAEKTDEMAGNKGPEYYTEASRRLLCVARLIMEPALMRKESRGGHYREDYPCSDEAYAVHSVQQIGQETQTAPVNSEYFNF